MFPVVLMKNKLQKCRFSNLKSITAILFLMFAAVMCSQQMFAQLVDDPVPRLADRLVSHRAAYCGGRRGLRSICGWYRLECDRWGVQFRPTQQPGTGAR